MVLTSECGTRNPSIPSDRLAFHAVAQRVATAPRDTLWRVLFGSSRGPCPPSVLLSSLFPPLEPQGESPIHCFPSPSSVRPWTRSGCLSSSSLFVLTQASTVGYYTSVKAPPGEARPWGSVVKHSCRNPPLGHMDSSSNRRMTHPRPLDVAPQGREGLVRVSRGQNAAPQSSASAPSWQWTRRRPFEGLEGP